MKKITWSMGTLVFLLSLFLAACTPRQMGTPSPSPPPGSTTISTWKGLPIIPGASEGKEGIGAYGAGAYYVYTANADVADVKRFYQDQMQSARWELLSVGDVSVRGTDIGKAYSLLFAKSGDLVTISVFTKDDMTYVGFHFEQ